MVVDQQGPSGVAVLVDMNRAAVAGPDVKLTRLGDCRLHAQEHMAAATPRSTFRELPAAIDVPQGRDGLLPSTRAPSGRLPINGELPAECESCPNAAGTPRSRRAGHQPEDGLKIAVKRRKS
jgi:hypothetical protein